MLQVNNISLSYGPRLVLDDVSFTVAPGEKAGLIGVNGATATATAGGSTTAYIADGASVSADGTVAVNASSDTSHDTGMVSPKKTRL